MRDGAMEDRLRRDRDALVEAMLPHVPFDGWTPGCARRAAADAGLEPEDAGRLFPAGPIDIVAHYCDLADRRMLVALAERDLPSLRVRDRIATAVRVRLEAHAGERVAIRRAIAVTAMPPHAAAAARALYRTVDAIWRVAGDTATDFSFYTKRGLLAWVYTSTLLYWLDDESEGQADSWAFLDRRIGEVLQIPKIRGRVERAFRFAPNPVRTARAFRRGAAQFRARR
ncbi:MAG: COQ9 family protein [Alphaproteobacteria bacterium]